MFKEILETILQSFASVIALFILTRIMGKKQISQLTFFDYVVGISIGSIAAVCSTDSIISFEKGIVSMIVYTMFAIILSYISLKSYTIRKFLDGVPTILIENGKIIENNLKKTKMNINDLLEECRIKNVFDLRDIEYAILETNGRLSIQLKSDLQPLTPKDMSLPKSYKGLCINIIIDGKVIYEHLNSIDKDIVWIETELKKQGINDYSSVLLAYVDTSNNLTIQIKNLSSFDPSQEIL
jgi:uncharacterized membrane protein YcaP (DUF421 family)